MKNLKKQNLLILFLQLLLIAALSLMLIGCGSKKKFSEKEKTVRIDTITVVKTVTDTIYRDSIVEKTRPVYYETVVESPCDSLGNLRPINAQIGSGKNKAWIYSKDGKLFVGQYLDSVQSVSENNYIARWRKDSINLRRNLEKEFVSTSKTTKYVWPWWLYGLVVFGVCSLIFNIYQKFKPL